jgi:hypothetical protein
MVKASSMRGHSGNLGLNFSPPMAPGFRAGTA